MSDQSAPATRTIEIQPTREFRRVPFPAPDGTVLYGYIQARLARADEHFQQLKADIPAIWKDDRARIASKFDEDGTQRGIEIYYRRPDCRLRWSAIFSDYVHCLRSALNNCVFAVAAMQVGARPLDEKVSQALSFPIADTVKDWKDRRVQRSIESLPNDVVAIITAAQPCNGGNPILSTLGRVSNADKHKLPTSIDGVFRKIDLAPYYGAAVGRIVYVRALTGPRVSDAPLLTLTYEKRQPPDKDEMEIDFSFDVFTLDRNEWRPVLDVMREMSQETRRLIELLKPFVAL